MTYDPFTELTMREVKGTRKQNYQYDGKKERVLKIDSNGTVVKTVYLQGLNDYPLMVINGSNEYVYVYGIGGMVAMRVNGTWFYIMRDHLGSTKLIINNTSSVVARYEYDPYGKYLDSLYINTGSAYQFTGQELDETGLYNFRARMYDTSAAIFYAADPANQGYSRYGYCGGNPVILIDPTGREYGQYQTADMDADQNDSRRTDFENDERNAQFARNQFNALPSAAQEKIKSGSYTLNSKKGSIAWEPTGKETGGWEWDNELKMWVFVVIAEVRPVWVPNEDRGDWNGWNYIEQSKNILGGVSTGIYYEGTQTYMRLSGEGSKLIYSLKSSGAKYVQMAEQAKAVAKYIEGAGLMLEGALLINSSVNAVDASYTNNPVMKAETKVDVAVGGATFIASRNPIAAPFAIIGNLSYGISKQTIGPYVAKIFYPNVTIHLR
jgi:RHS repeat-associated protein